MTITRNGLLVLALDSLDVGLAEQWAAAGHLPHLRRLFERSAQGERPTRKGWCRGRCGRASSPAPARACTASGTGSRASTRRTYRRLAATSIEADLRYRPFFTRLSDAGKRVGVIDRPTPPLRRSETASGRQIGMTHLRVYRGGPMPHHAGPTWRKSCTQKFGDDPFPAPGLCATDAAEVSTVDGVRDFLERTLHQRDTNAMRAAANLAAGARAAGLLSSSIWTWAHDIRHMLWHVFDTMAPNHPRRSCARGGRSDSAGYPRDRSRQSGELTAAAGRGLPRPRLSQPRHDPPVETATYTLDAVLLNG